MYDNTLGKKQTEFPSTETIAETLCYNINNGFVFIALEHRDILEASRQVEVRTVPVMLEI